jgi:hypothetical protein
MATHIYVIGETVSLNFDDGQFFSKLNPFKIEAHLPPLGTSLQYRVKSESETCRRVVPESQLSSFGSQPNVAPTIFIGPHPGEAD